MNLTAEMPAIREIEYILADGTRNTATIVPVEVPIKGMSKRDLATMDAISRAVDGMTPIFANQIDARTRNGLYRALLDVEAAASGESRALIDDFNTLFSVRNGPFTKDGDGFRFPLEFRLSRDSKAIPEGHPLREYENLLLCDSKAPKTRNFYPADITAKEFHRLGKRKKITNSSVTRQEDGLHVILNEERYVRELRPVTEFLEFASVFSRNPQLSAYLEAKIAELRDGSKEAQRVSDLTWLENDGKIDFILGTGVETYLDHFRKVRGAALGAVFVLDREYTALTKTLVGMLAKWEATAPWKHKKKVDKSNIPALKFVNVFNWSGDYNGFPFTYMAQSLPNDKEVIDEHGSVNVVFVNIQRAKAGMLKYTGDEFFPNEDVERYHADIADMQMLMNAIHELGHTTGGTKLKEDPAKYFGSEFSRMDEAISELFSMWTLPSLVKAGVITQDQEIAGYYSMLINCIRSNLVEPNDHSAARIMMWYYFAEQGAIAEIHEDGKLKYAVNPDKMRLAVSNMLGTLSNMKAEGRKRELVQFRTKYIRDDLRDSVRERLRGTPLGGGFIFPVLERDGRGYTGNLLYPTSFREQRRALNHFV